MKRSQQHSIAGASEKENSDPKRLAAKLGLVSELVKLELGSRPPARSAVRSEGWMSFRSLVLV